MDLLKDATKHLSLYEVKAYVRKAQNVAMNLTEMEAKVREATNNEPWGASTKLMSQISGGTYNYREREEIISFIFRRFTEKATNEWRQIYKALQLLDYLIRNGSERIIDDVRSNLSLIQMLKSFHYIDSKGRDQGINVRNRAKNLINLLNDDNQLRNERKKARTNQKKFGGVSSAAFGGASSISTGGEAEDGDFTNRVFGDGGVYGARYDDSAEEYNRQRQQQQDSNDNFEEYNVEVVDKKKAKPSAQVSQPAAEPDLLGDLMGGSSNGATQTSTQAPVATADDDDDDDFDDFQSAPTSNPAAASNLSNLSNLYSNSTTTNSFQPNFQHQQSFSTPSYNNQPSSQSSGPVHVTKKKDDAFSSLFSSAKTRNVSNHSTPSTPVNNNVSTTAPSNTNSTPANNSSTSNGEIDLLSF
ncbi:epsin-3 [[Candida] jaroonii]|uniref:Epsin-3 n=1 Tax=[Candida] jaroonii TaxID=467808 RepID=A0ACA9Y8N8_9ASCO|nr:epsin-3 [[Candida] jaroonii]